MARYRIEYALEGSIEIEAEDENEARDYAYGLSDREVCDNAYGSVTICDIQEVE